MEFVPEEDDSVDTFLCSTEEENKGRLMYRQQGKEDVKQIALNLFPFRGTDTGRLIP